MMRGGERFAISLASTDDEAIGDEYGFLNITPTLLDRNGTVLSTGASSVDEIPLAGSTQQCSSSRYGEPIVCRDENGAALWQTSDSVANDPLSYSSDLTFLAVALQKGSVAAPVSVLRAYRARPAEPLLAPGEIKAGQAGNSWARPNHGLQPTPNEGAAEP